ncbi:hypothetical protein CHS0354_018431 [Potamilus streckersoni]|uniref:UDP-N-acetylmuramoyl-tripeptide--D-alanyl-D-alanine ligase n=1 Tax=Potamilus streckersoni TaxID=2493646 RepID=A0AAE0TAE3_9BIVA|nr:hypothetical protein CHS0354_018431 [Potamilus streckersoni]
MLTCAELPGAAGGRWLVPPAPEKADTVISGAAFDTRRIREEMLVAVVERELPAYPPGIAVLKTDDTLKALQQTARAIHQRFSGKTIAVTGSNGKTTCKTWLAGTLSTFMPVRTSEGSFNNHIGCPVTVAGLRAEHQALVLETGANAVGEIGMLTALYPPDIAVILNVGSAHVGKFGGLHNTYIAKTEIADNIKSGGVLFIPDNDPELERRCREKNNIRSGAVRLKHYPAHTVRILKNTPDGQEIELADDKSIHRIQTAVSGLFAGRLFSLIMAIAEEMGLNTAQVAPVFSRLANAAGRLQLKQTAGGARIVDDSYNANPNSVAHLAEMMSGWDFAHKYLVLGHLAELDGDDAAAADIIAKGLNDRKIELVCTGETAQRIGGLAAQKTGCACVSFPDNNAAAAYCRTKDTPGTLFGIKGSNSAKMWEVVRALTP